MQALESLCTTTICSPVLLGVVASEAIRAALGGGSMHDPASELLRIYLPRTWVNKGKKKGRGCHCPGPLCRAPSRTLAIAELAYRP